MSEIDRDVRYRLIERLRDLASNHRGRSNSEVSRTLLHAAKTLSADREKVASLERELDELGDVITELESSDDFMPTSEWRAEKERADVAEQKVAVLTKMVDAATVALGGVAGPDLPAKFRDYTGQDALAMRDIARDALTILDRIKAVKEP